ncbi:soluble guanylate cyclase 89Db isoform X1 [Pieris rapae]|uniref:soluble guanylate cyclase 89Db isoform X1 n=2 Tax=Pieris rapae TaxID=64459 RepID=UPI001E281630|nr:soluble guanylate cyclase 89Db isoform X1 [Pieris rapae]
MYGMLLESVQHFIVQECGEDVWETILQEAGAKNTVFMTRQQYPDALMLRLACALSRLLNNDPNSPTICTPVTPPPRKSSLKSKPAWRSASVHSDNRSQTFKCPFSAVSALTAVTKKEIEAYNSSEEIKSSTQSTISTEKICELEELDVTSTHQNRDRRSLGVHLESLRSDDTKSVTVTELPKDSEPTSPISDASKFSSLPKTSSSPSDSRKSSLKPRKVSITVALDVYKRRGSGNTSRQRLNSLSLLSADRLKALKERFGTPDKIMHFFGRCFVKFFSNFGYDTMIRATGRYFCTFLQSVDSIHQRMRFTFPQMKSPRMQLTRAHIHGAELVYSSARTGYTHYLMGQLYEIAEDIFSLKLKVTIVKEDFMEGNNHYVAVLRLEFDNSDYVQSLMAKKSLPCPLPAVPATLLTQLFPFGVLLDRKMKILVAGDKLIEAWGGPYKRIYKTQVSEILRLRKPKISFTWDKVVCMQNMMFELELVRWRSLNLTDSRRGSQGTRSILLKGPIYLLEEIDALIFLCSPIFNNLDELRLAGLYVADMNGHGLSKEMLLQGWQHLSRLELLFEKAENRSLTLEKSWKLRDEWKKKGDHLLYSMIPKTVAYQLRAGKMPEAEHFDCVSVMFCGFQIKQTGTREDVMATVGYMNSVYSKIDRLLDSHQVYKVETVGTVYMVVAGAPERRRRPAHAECVASAALAVSRALPVLTIGIHSGPCQAGVLGHKQPRYCLVGDTVNTASRMQTTSEPGRIQISAQTAEELPSGKFRLRRRGLIKVKGKGQMETFWLEGEIEEDEQDEALQLFSKLCEENE